MASYAYTKSPWIYGAGEHFRIERYVRPGGLNPPAEPTSGTVFVFRSIMTVPAAVAIREKYRPRPTRSSRESC